MATTNHTDITVGAPDNAATFNVPLGALDAAIGDLSTLDSPVITSVVAAINSFYGGTYSLTGSVAPYPALPSASTIGNWKLVIVVDGTAGQQVRLTTASNTFINIG